MFIIVLAILVILALLLYLVPLVISDAPAQRIAKAGLIAGAIILIAQRAGLLR